MPSIFMALVYCACSHLHSASENKQILLNSCLASLSFLLIYTIFHVFDVAVTVDQIVLGLRPS